MATITLTAADVAGVASGYVRPGSPSGLTAPGSSISAEPFAGFTTDVLVTSTTPGFDFVSLLGNTTGAFTETSFTVNGNTWAIGSGTYNGSSATDYPLTTSGGEFANGVAYTIVTGGGGPANPNITSSSAVPNLVNTTLAHTITADKTIASTAIIGGADAASFEINGTATLRFASNAASSALGPLVVQIQITDTDGLTATQTITVTVKAIVFKGIKVYSRPGATTTATSSLTDFGNPLTGATGIAAAVGDTVVVFPAIGSNADRDMIITTGYTEVADHYINGTTYDANIGAFIKTLASADTTVTFGSSGSANDAQGGVILLFRGVDATTPLDVAVVLDQGTGTGTPNPAAITPVTTGAVGVFGGAQAAATAANLTSSDLTAFRQVIQADTNDIAVGAGFIEWTSGAINPAAFGGGSSNSANSWATVSLALRPAWTAGGTSPAAVSGSASGTGAIAGQRTAASPVTAAATGSASASGRSTAQSTATATGSGAGSVAGQTIVSASLSSSASGAGAIQGASVVVSAGAVAGAGQGAGAIQGAAASAAAIASAGTGATAISGQSTRAAACAGSAAGSASISTLSSAASAMASTASGAGTVAGNAILSAILAASGSGASSAAGRSSAAAAFSSAGSGSSFISSASNTTISGALSSSALASASVAGRQIVAATLAASGAGQGAIVGTGIRHAAVNALASSSGLAIGASQVAAAVAGDASASGLFFGSYTYSTALVAEGQGSGSIGGQRLTMATLDAMAVSQCVIVGSGRLNLPASTSRTITDPRQSRIVSPSLSDRTIRTTQDRTIVTAVTARTITRIGSGR